MCYLYIVQAADRRKEVEILKKRQAVEEVELKARRGDVEEELKGVQPLIDQVCVILKFLGVEMLAACSSLLIHEMGTRMGAWGCTTLSPMFFHPTGPKVSWKHKEGEH